MRSPRAPMRCRHATSGIITWQYNRAGAATATRRDRGEARCCHLDLDCASASRPHEKSQDAFPVSVCSLLALACRAGASKLEFAHEVMPPSSSTRVAAGSAGGAAPAT